MKSKHVFYMMCLAVLAAGLWYGLPRKPRHVIFITLDTTRADHLGAYGNKQVKTPNMDAFEKDAVVFENAYSAVNVTLPSHTSLFTSMYVRDHGVMTNTLVLREFPEFLPKLYKSAGYKTAAFTSASVLVPDANINQGFDDFAFTDNYQCTAEETNKRVFSWLDKNKGEDFFMWIHYFDPHMTYNPPAPYNSMYNNKSTDKLSKLPIKNSNMIFERLWDNFFELSDDPEYFRNLYKGEISYLDEHLGRFFAKLKEQGVYEDCIIVVVADHGESLGEHGIYFDHGGIYDTTIKVPLLVKTSGQAHTGRREQVVSSLDIYPTLLDLSGLKQTVPIDGKDLAGIINDPASPEVRKEIYYQSTNENIVGIKDDKYTFIRRFYLRNETHPIAEAKFIEDTSYTQKLYDNEKDPGQQVNLSETEPAAAAVYEKKARAFIKDRKGPTTSVEITDKEHLNKLKALGYLQ